MLLVTSSLPPRPRVPLYVMTDAAITPVPTTSFSAESVRERADLQRLLRDHVGIVAPDTLVIAEEFSSWEGSSRRIDLLAVDKAAHLVVIELKRDETGAHMELQALRYAAMVARMTFDQAVEAYAAYLARGGSSADARGALLQFLEWGQPDEAAFAQDVRIVLVAAAFSRELTTSVMWLNERDLDITCVQVQPYRLAGQLLLHVDQVIPLPEAGDFQVEVRAKARLERAAVAGVRNNDWTRYDLRVGEATFAGLPKRRLVYHTVRYAIERLGATPDDIARLLRHSRLWLSADGTHGAEGFRAAFDGNSKVDLTGWLAREEELLHVGGRTYAFTKAWGGPTALPAMEALRAAYPAGSITYQPVAGTEV
jgi:hypothetical protein